jgi:hypothetical protein
MTRILTVALTVLILVARPNQLQHSQVAQLIGPSPVIAGELNADAVQEVQDTAAQTTDLYRSVFVVTGQGEKNRAVGFAHCFADVLVKVTGDSKIVKDRRFSKRAATAKSFVQSFTYRDLFEGKPMHDEQGSYDRPHFLTVTFDRAKIDGLVRSLGREPWLPPRPRLVVFLGVENLKPTFMLASDSVLDRSVDMRSAFAAAAAKAGISVRFPKLTELEAHGWTANSLPHAALVDVAAIAGSNGGDVAVSGRIVFREEKHGWIATWRLEHRGKVYEWGVSGVNFDAAFRNAVFGAANILSGHGPPEN